MIALFLLLLAQESSAASIQAASNLQQDRLTLVVTTGEEKKPRRLLDLDLRNMTPKHLPWPMKSQEEEVMGLIRSPERLFVITQFTAGGGKLPNLHQYDFTKGSWKSLGRLDCLSFDSVEIRKNELLVECEADPRANKPAGVKRFSLPQNESSLKLILPVAHDNQGDTSFRLEGSMFAWDAVELSRKNTVKKLSATDLLKQK